MTTPEVPPYSSTTTASCIPPWRSWSSSGSSRSVSGTSTACTISADTGTSPRRSNGTAMAFLTCTMPSMSSQSAPTTGKREWPVRRASATTSAAVAVRSIDVARERGVMTSAAVWSAKPRDAVTSRAVPRSRVPASADVRTSEASSAGLRAADSSSWGSMPSASSVRLATPLSSRIIGFIAMPNQRTGRGRDLRRGERQRDREGLGHHLADDHREHRGDEHREHRRPSTTAADCRQAQRLAAGRGAAPRSTGWR